MTEKQHSEGSYLLSMLNSLYYDLDMVNKAIEGLRKNKNVPSKSMDAIAGSADFTSPVPNKIKITIDMGYRNVHESIIVDSDHLEIILIARKKEIETDIEDCKTKFARL